MATLSDQLRSRFASSAKHHSHAAVAAYQADSPPDFYLHAGTALELAIKARLVGEHGVYCIAPDERQWFAMLAVYETEGIDAPRSRTVGAAEALRRLKQLERNLPDVFGRDVAETLARRNTGAHVGHTTALDEDLLGHAATFVRAIDVLLLHDPGKFWGDLADLADSLVEEDLNEVRVRVRRAISKSKAIAATLPPDAFEALETAAMSALEEEGADVVAVQCPACGAMAWAIGNVVDDGTGEGEYEDGVVSWHWAPDLNLEVREFICRTCDLNLEGSSEIVEAGLPLKVPNDRAAPSDAIEYDSDFYRD